MTRRIAVALACAVCFALPPASRAFQPARLDGSCFLLTEIGVGEVRRNPSSSCTTAMSPQSTFKIPHALAALDSGVVASPDEVIRYDGHPVDQDAWKRDHTLATAIRYSVVWYFQSIAQRLGPDREREYLRRFHYGNADPSSGLTTFWLGGSLLVTPEQERSFLLDLYADRLAVKKSAADAVRTMLLQPKGMVVNATGEHPFAAPWPSDAVVSAKTGAGRDRTGSQVRWLVGHVRRGPRGWIFVSNVAAPGDVDGMAAVDLAARNLQAAGVLR